MRRRWLSGGIVTLLSTALLFSGMGVAFADADAPDPDPVVATQQADDATGESIPDPSTSDSDTSDAGTSDSAANGQAPLDSGQSETTTGESGATGSDDQAGEEGSVADPDGITSDAEGTESDAATGTDAAIDTDIDDATETDRVADDDAPSDLATPEDTDSLIATDAEPEIGALDSSSLMAMDDDATFNTLAAPPGAGESGVYHAESDNNDPLTWYSSGDPAEATKINSFSSSYTQSGDDWILGATWTRPSATGTKGWSIEYTVAPERWGAAQGTILVPQPNRSQGGMVIIIENSNQQNYTTQRCTYTSLADYPGDCVTVSNALSSPDGGFTMVLSLTLSSDFIGQQGCPSTLGSTGYIRSWTGSRNIQAWVAPVSVTPPSTCGSLMIHKHNEHATGLAGATFVVTPNPTTGKGNATIVTGADGAYAFSNNVVPGTYTVTETIAPAGYLLPSTVTQNVVIGDNESKSVTFVDPLGSVSWLKHDQEAALLGGATFVITATGGDAAGAPWDLDSSPLTVVDNTGQVGYTGLDTDPRPGEFTVVDLPTGTYSVSETVAPEDYDLDATAQTFTISDQTPHPTLSEAFVNTLTLATLTLVKEIAFGGADASAWELSATGPTGSLVFTSGASGVSGDITANSDYTLGEDDPLPQYLQSGDWVCKDVTDPQDPQTVTLTTAGVVAVPPGDHYECTVTNTTAKLTILKFVEGGNADPATWNVGATPDDSVPTLPALDAPGSLVETADNTWEVRPGHAYDLTESFDDPNSQLAYLFDRVERWDTVTNAWVEVTDFSAVAVAAGAHDTYRFVNKPAPRVALPLTGGLGSDLFLVSGGALLALAGAIVLWRRRETLLARITGGAASGTN